MTTTSRTSRRRSMRLAVGTAFVVCLLILASSQGQQPSPAPQPIPPIPEPLKIDVIRPREVFDKKEEPKGVLTPVFGPQGNFAFTFDPKTPLSELLPTPPTKREQKPSAFLEDLSKVPEVMLTDPFTKDMNPKVAIEAIVKQNAKILHLNKVKADNFISKLIAERPDLAGLPFEMGDKCRQPTSRSRQFTRAVSLVHTSAQGVEEDGNSFLQRFMQNALADDVNMKNSSGFEAHGTSTRIAAMSQICSPSSEGMRLAIVKYIASVSSAESSRQLARLVLYSLEKDVRSAAIEALKARRESDYTPLLMQGFRYPWPAVSKRAADALIKLQRQDLLRQLVDELDQPDPRAPIVKEVDGKQVATVREVVRINHHRNCQMCHPPGQDVVNPNEVLTAEIPAPGQPLPSFNNGGYRNQGFAELLMRIDVTYLRQDFSMLLPVADAHPWPEMQRFDFVTRTRTLNEEELKAYREKFDHLEPGMVRSNHKAALAALRELTGKDAAPTAEAWRKLLNLPRGSEQLTK